MYVPCGCIWARSNTVVPRGGTSNGAETAATPAASVYVVMRPVRVTSDGLAMTAEPPSCGPPTGTPAQNHADVTNEPFGTNGMVALPSRENWAGALCTGRERCSATTPTIEATTISPATNRRTAIIRHRPRDLRRRVRRRLALRQARRPRRTSGRVPRQGLVVHRHQHRVVERDRDRFIDRQQRCFRSGIDPTASPAQQRGRVEPADSQGEQQPQQQLPDQLEGSRCGGVVPKRCLTRGGDVVAGRGSECRTRRNHLTADAQRPPLVDAGRHGHRTWLDGEIDIGVVGCAECRPACANGFNSSLANESRPACRVASASAAEN